MGNIDLACDIARKKYKWIADKMARRMLKDLETHIDSTQGRLDAVMRRVDKLLEENGGS